MDVARKLAGRDECPLCTLTHGATGERASWRACKEALQVPVEAVHRDERTPALRALSSALPYVAAESGGELSILLEKDGVTALGGDTRLLERALRDRARAQGLEFPDGRQ